MNRNVASLLVNPVHARGTHLWAAFVCDAHCRAIDLQQSFTVDERATSSLVAPRGNIITTTGDPASVAHDLSSTIQLDVTSPLAYATEAPKGVRFVAACLRKLAEWRAFFYPEKLSFPPYTSQAPYPLRPRHRLDPTFRHTPWQSSILLHRTCYQS